MKKIFELNKKASIAILLMIFLVTFSFLGVARYQKNSALIGDESYYHLRLSENIEKNGFEKNGLSDNDLSLILGQKYYFNLIDFVLSLVKHKIIFMITIPLLLGLASLIFFYLALSRIGIENNQVFFSSILLILSPPFIYIFSSYTVYPFLVFFNILFLFLYLNNMKKLSFLAIIPTLFISLPSVFLTSLILFFIYIFNKKDKREILISSSLLILTSLIIYFTFYFPNFIPNKLFFFHRNIFSRIISDLGASIGISIFHLVLAFIGLLVIKTKEKRFPNYLILLFALILSIFFNLIMIFFNFFVCFLASYSLSEIYHKKWEIDVLKNITLILIIYGLLFSSFSFQTRLISSSPTIEEINALAFLKDNPSGVVFSHFSNGYQIEYFSEKSAMIDQRIYTLNNGKELLNDSNTIFFSRNIQTTKKLLEKNNISYIFINKEMKDGLIWDKRNQGLLFLLDKSTDFKNIYDKDEVEIWQVLSSKN